MVSTNNTCRSFIAESILRQYLLDADQKNVEVISRGLVVLFPEPVHVKAADMVIKTCGIESLDFRSAQLTQEEVEESDLILTMTEEQKDKILEEEIVAKDIVFVLDTSGSMADEGKMDKARAALLFGIKNLRDQDRFNVIGFAGEEHLMEKGLIKAEEFISWFDAHYQDFHTRQKDKNNA